MIRSIFAILLFAGNLHALVSDNTTQDNLLFEEKIIYADIPFGIALSKCDCGYGVFATKPFKAGEVLYTGRYKLIGNPEGKYVLKTAQGDFALDAKTHSVAIENGLRALYTFDSFMNHSCDPNTFSTHDPEMIARCEYTQVALKDINKGDQITCDYDLFEYDCIDKNITNCCCHSKNCRKEIRGFQGLPFSEQTKRLALIDASVLQRFLADHPEILYIEDLKVPAGIRIVKDNDTFKIVANKNFRTGDVVYENHTLYFPEEKLILVHLNEEFFFLDNFRHTVNRGNAQREFFYFDSYMNHSCNPNTISFYLTPTHYEGRALRSISVGDELTCDYSVFDTYKNEDGFQCQCGSSNCRGFID